jgi:hypothetical protein
MQPPEEASAFAGSELAFRKVHPPAALEPSAAGAI